MKKKRLAMRDDYAFDPDINALRAIVTGEADKKIYSDVKDMDQGIRDGIVKIITSKKRSRKERRDEFKRIADIDGNHYPLREPKSDEKTGKLIPNPTKSKILR